jgi:pimeloyl-ACP methyl ester carboxylesterase
MKGKVQCVVQAVLLAMVCLPLPAAAAGIFAPYILHPLRREITADEMKSADQAFAQIGATRTDLVVTACDGVVLRGWKVLAAHPKGNWVLLLHGRSQNRLSMMGYARFLLNSGYSVVMMDARAHGESGGLISTYGHVERHDVKAVMDALTASENVDHAYALGESMGAAVALQAAAVDPRIEGVIAEGAETDSSLRSLEAGTRREYHEEGSCDGGAAD